MLKNILNLKNVHILNKAEQKFLSAGNGSSDPFSNKCMGRCGTCSVNSDCCSGACSTNQPSCPHGKTCL